MRGGEGPSGAVSIWSWSPLFVGRPLNLVLYMPFRIFAYSSNMKLCVFGASSAQPHNRRSMKTHARVSSGEGAHLA
jgi:hypothetical protein